MQFMVQNLSFCKQFKGQVENHKLNFNNKSPVKDAEYNINYSINYKF
ncbi:hypothetical protein pb186bvf_006482 [Paramecium bursaria]